MWERTWRYPSGFLRLTAGAWFGLGLRIPIQVEGRLNPKYIHLRGSRDGKQSYTVRFKARTLDADESFYEATGLKKSKVFDGDEFVMTLGYGYGYKLRALWTTVEEKPYKEYPSVHESVDFTPPLSSRYQTVHPGLFLPARLTNTDFGGGPLRGSVRFGIKLSAKGKVKLTFHTVVDGKRRPSHDRRERRERWNSSHQITFDSARDESAWYATTFPIQGRSGTQSYGYNFSNLRYRSSWGITPGIDLSLRVGYKGLNKRFNHQLWFDDFLIEIGSTTSIRTKGRARAFRRSRGRSASQSSDPRDEGSLRVLPRVTARSPHI